MNSQAMNSQAEQRNVRDRRSARFGGRRASDWPSLSVEPPNCPACLRTSTAVLAGEAEGGWWWVCVACDHLWDERSRATAYAGRSIA